MKKILRLGTRGSPLALLQADEVQKALFARNPDLHRDIEIEIVPIRTNGDWRPGAREVSFRDTGSNKELFTKEIEEALATGHIDFAVHSMKDVSSWLADGLELCAFLPRVDPRDAFLSRDYKTLADLPATATVGTSSVRRQAQVLAYRPDLRVVPLRGNVETRLKKLESAQADAIILAMAGLLRLGMEKRAASVIDTDIMLPAAAQGTIGIEVRSDDTQTCALLATINDINTAACINAERALLGVLGGTCYTPIGALATLGDDDMLTLEGMAAQVDGTAVTRLRIKGAVADAKQLGSDLGKQMKDALPAGFFDA